MPEDVRAVVQEDGSGSEGLGGCTGAVVEAPAGHVDAPKGCSRGTTSAREDHALAGEGDAPTGAGAEALAQGGRRTEVEGRGAGKSGLNPGNRDRIFAFEPVPRIFRVMARFAPGNVSRSRSYRLYILHSQSTYLIYCRNGRSVYYSRYYSRYYYQYYYSPRTSDTDHREYSRSLSHTRRNLQGYEEMMPRPFGLAAQVRRV